MSTARKLTLADLREIVFDPDELAKGARVVDDGTLSHLARYENKLYADARGSSPVPYKVQVTFEEKVVRARCSCMAARTRPYCKHGAGLLVAWAQAPESFVEASAPPETDAQAKKLAVKRGSVATKDLMARGVEQASTLVRELAVSGVASIASDRVDQVRDLAEALREAKLRRVAGRTRALSDHLARAAARTGAFEAGDYAELIGDILLTVRKLEKHLAGEPLSEEHVEELIGKTWTKKDRKPIDGLDLVEYAFMSRETADEFVIRESRFFDLASGGHFAEKQILPGFLVRRSTPKKSYAGRVLRRVSGSLFPSYPPRRVDIESIGDTEMSSTRAVEDLLERSLPSVVAVLDAVQARRRDVFAPEALPVSMRVDAILADGARLRLVDSSGAALFLPDDAHIDETLGRILRGSKILGLIGDVALDGALPTMFPLAAVLEAGDARDLVPLGGLDTVSLLQSRKLKKEALLADRRTTSHWADVAREAGVRGAAVIAGEVREEMAEALATGLSSVVPRFADPISVRLDELGLTKQAELVRTIATRQDPADKVDDFIKVHQVLGIALTRLAGAAPVEQSRLTRVSTHPSVLVRTIEEERSPREVTALRGAGKINRYEAIAHYARYYESKPPEELARTLYPTWADGGATAFVARAVAALPETGLVAAERALGPSSSQDGAKAGETRATGRVAKLTAIQVLERIGTPEATELLVRYIKRREDPALVAHAQESLARIRGDGSVRRSSAEMVYRAIHASSQKTRVDALAAIAAGGHVEAIPALRASLVGDVVAGVRQAAAFTLAALGDVESVETFVAMLRMRLSDPAQAKVGARALGILGDVRGVDELLEAYTSGFQPAVVAEALGSVGAAALEPFLDRLEADPSIADKKQSASIFAAIPADDLLPALTLRLSAVEDEVETFSARALAFLNLCAATSTIARDLAKQIVAMRPSLSEKKQGTAAEKSLAKACAKAMS
ncbi:MAG: HEAT repeat domain-containing protein [Polyangiaceae bacterium]|nr:HEAT repeat domain-containing protein [Polyangiaceae bacterium]